MPKNVLVIIPDDMGREQLSFYGINPNVENYAYTPRITSLAQGGLTFTRAYTQPWCSPTRAEMLTGAYGFQQGIGALADRQNQPLLESEVCLPRAIKEATGNAYVTALIGKHHLSTDLNYGGAFEHPVRCGFDYWAGPLLNFLATEDYYAWNRTVSYREGPKIVVETAPCLEYAPLQNVRDGLAWVEKQTKPWYLQLAFNIPHFPYTRPPAYMFNGEKWPCPNWRGVVGDRNYYKASIEALDYCVGLFLDGLTPAVRANTVVLFVTDNGTPRDVADPEYDVLYPTVNHFKQSPYELGMRCPLVVNGPGVSFSGKQTDALVKTLDIFRTVIDMVDGDYNLVSTNPNHGRPSTSYWPVCTGAATTARSVIWTDSFSPNGPNLNCSTTGTRTLIYQRYKLIRDRLAGTSGFPASPVGTGNASDLFFDLTTDPNELDNLIAGSFDLTALEPAHPGITAAYDAAVSLYGTFTSTYA